MGKFTFRGIEFTGKSSPEDGGGHYLEAEITSGVDKFKFGIGYDIDDEEDEDPATRYHATVMLIDESAGDDSVEMVTPPELGWGFGETPEAAIEAALARTEQMIGALRKFIAPLTELKTAPAHGKPEFDA